MSQDKKNQASWKTQLYVVGVAIGAVLGFLSAYLFAQEAEPDVIEEGKERPEVSPIAVLGLATSTLALVRTIAETGKKPKVDKERKK